MTSSKASSSRAQAKVRDNNCHFGLASNFGGNTSARCGTGGAELQILEGKEVSFIPADGEGEELRCSVTKALARLWATNSKMEGGEVIEIQPNHLHSVYVLFFTASNRWPSKNFQTPPRPPSKYLGSIIYKARALFTINHEPLQCITITDV